MDRAFKHPYIIKSLSGMQNVATVTFKEDPTVLEFESEVVNPRSLSSRLVWSGGGKLSSHRVPL